MTRPLFITESVVNHYAVVIVRTGVPIFTTNDLGLAKERLREVARRHGELEVREVVTTVMSRRAYKPRPVAKAEPPTCGEDRDLAIPACA